jgi:hypothetical protein
VGVRAKVPLQRFLWRWWKESKLYAPRRELNSGPKGRESPSVFAFTAPSSPSLLSHSHPPVVWSIHTLIQFPLPLGSAKTVSPVVHFAPEHWPDLARPINPSPFTRSPSARTLPCPVSALASIMNVRFGRKGAPTDTSLGTKYSERRKTFPRPESQDSVECSQTFYARTTTQCTPSHRFYFVPKKYLRPWENGLAILSLYAPKSCGLNWPTAFCWNKVKR